MSYYGTSPEYQNSEKFRKVVENVNSNIPNIYPTDGSIDSATGKYKNISNDVAFTKDIFNVSKMPESPSSDFNEHKRAVIQLWQTLVEIHLVHMNLECLKLMKLNGIKL